MAPEKKKRARKERKDQWREALAGESSPVQRPEQTSRHEIAPGATPPAETATEQAPAPATRFGGKKKMADNGSVFDNLSGLGKQMLSFQGAKKFAAWYIDTNEQIAKNAIDFQARLTNWAKDTPLAPVFEAQQEFGRRLVERSADAARAIWRLKQEEIHN